MSTSGKDFLVGKKILYVTSDWSGLRDLLLDEKDQPSGMPAFFEPLYQLVKDGACIEMIIVSNRDYNKIGSRHPILSKVKISSVYWPSSKRIDNAVSVIKSIYQIYKYVKKFKPEFIYGLGPKGVLAYPSAKRFNIPFGIRVFGTNYYYDRLNSLGKISFAFSSPFMYMMFSLRSEFIIATDDGSRTDKIFDQIGNRSTSFYFLRNGFELPAERIGTTRNENELYLFYPGRISDKKQQILAVDIIHQLKNIGYEKVKLKFAGHVTDKRYFKEMMSHARALGVEKCIDYLGVLEKRRLLEIMKQSLAVLSFQKVSNLSNTLIEALSIGSIVVSYAEDSLLEFLADGESAILVEDINEVCEKLRELIENEKLESEIRLNAASIVKRNFYSWEKRSEQEIKVIANVMEKKPNTDTE